LSPHKPCITFFLGLACCFCPLIVYYVFSHKPYWLRHLFNSTVCIYQPYWLRHILSPHEPCFIFLSRVGLLFLLTLFIVGVLS
jgi:hypothetical protein